MKDKIVQEWFERGKRDLESAKLIYVQKGYFDEKMGGTIHMALGASYPESGGLNKAAIHWDIVKDMKKEAEIYADNKLFYKNGKFLIK